MDVVIFGGGAAGLWLLDELTRRGREAVLIEAHALGAGQTVASQGIIHGGLKYTLAGLLTDSAVSIREMPAVWRDCLDGIREPNLNAVQRRANCCYLWRTDSWSSRLGMLGANWGLRIAPEPVAADERPEVLRGCPGSVARLPEQVISPVSLIETLAERNRDRLLKSEPGGVIIKTSAAGQVDSIELRSPKDSYDIPLLLRPRHVVFTAGAGNAALRQSVGLPTESMQRRPLHMVMLRGALPMFQGHCVDGAATRVTITSEADSAGRVVWQVGGQIAEQGIAWDERTLLAKARAELMAVLPQLDLTATEWSTYRVDRAEGRMPGGRRPESVQTLRDGNCLTAWPTKLALVPQLVYELCELIGCTSLTRKGCDSLTWDRLPACRSDVKTRQAGSRSHKTSPPFRVTGPRPAVARPPWETKIAWIRDADLATSEHPLPAKAA